MVIAFFDCFSGISGDMILGALIDLGLDINLLAEELKRIDLKDYQISSNKVNRAGISGTRFKVLIEAVTGTQHPHHRNLDDICKIIEKSDLNTPVKDSSIAVFLRLADAEAKVHNIKPSDVHFHEVGAIDSIIDIVGSVISFQMMQFDKIQFSPIATGSGYVECKHARLPIPAPATAELLRGFKLQMAHVNCELTTPTGAAILTTLGEQIEGLPEFRLSKIGYGAGDKDNVELPNLLRVFVGEKEDDISSNGQQAQADEMWMVETNVDDVSGEMFGYVFDKLFEAGAVDAYMTPIQMKKSRPGVLISAIVPENRIRGVEAVLFDQSMTFGIRRYRVYRSKLVREIVQIETEYGKIRVKVGRLNGEIKGISPEYEDCKRIADEKDLSLKLVYNTVMAVAASRYMGVPKVRSA